MRKLTIIILLFIANSAFAQVVNTERIRLSTTASKWTGDFDFNFGLSQTRAGQVLRFNTAGKLQLSVGKTRWMLMSGYSVTQFLNIDEPGSVPKTFNRTQFAHLRYNRDITENLTWEAFLQEQHDQIHEIDLRLLSGTGPRLKLLETDTSQVYLGILYMFEYENAGPEDFIENNRDHRLSTYFALGFNFNRFLINHISYYQPRLDNWSDYRINSETTLSVPLSHRFSLNTSFTIIYDTRPLETVRRTRYNLSSGISIEF